MNKHMLSIDYANGTHELVLNEFLKINSQEFAGYGYDDVTVQTVKLIQDKIGVPDASVNFLSGGTQANAVAIKTFLRPHEAVISADIGHINVNECGAIEATGHKVIALPCENGKLTPELIEGLLKKHTSEHVLVPKMVYISNTLENGLVYNKEEVTALSNVCKKHGLYLFMDGARMGNALAKLEGDLTLKDIAELTDAFYIGGTKNGMLFGEALVITNEYAKAQIRHIMKQCGAIMAKTWVIAVQFKVMIENDLYIELGKNSNIRAKELFDGLVELGIEFNDDYCTNLLFPIFDKKLTKELSSKYVIMEVIQIDDTKAVVRLATSFKMDKDFVNMFLSDVKDALKKL